MTNTSLELTDERGDMEQIAKLYSNGNLSKHVRDLIWNNHKKIEKIEKNNKKIVLFQNIMFLFLGTTFLTIAFNAIIPLNIITITAVICLVLSGISTFIFAIINIKKSDKQMVVIK